MFATAWDTTADATEFADGMQTSFATRGIKADLRLTGARVDVVIGCDGAACKAPLDAMAALHKNSAPAKVPATTAAATKCLAHLSPAPPATPAATTPAPAPAPAAGSAAPH